MKNFGGQLHKNANGPKSKKLDLRPPNIGVLIWIKIWKPRAWQVPRLTVRKCDFSIFRMLALWWQFQWWLNTSNWSLIWPICVHMSDGVTAAATVTEIEGGKVLNKHGRQPACGPIRGPKPIFLDSPIKCLLILKR